MVGCHYYYKTRKGLTLLKYLEIGKKKNKKTPLVSLSLFSKIFVQSKSNQIFAGERFPCIYARSQLVPQPGKQKSGVGRVAKS